MTKPKLKYNKGAHQVYSLIYHIVLVVKYRKQVFQDGIGIIEFTKDIFSKTAKEFDVEILEMECGTDHAHLLISAKPTIELSKFLNILKGHSSRYIREKFKTFLKNKLCGDNFWSPSYFIATTGNVSIDVLKEYVENQRAKINTEE